MERFPPSLQQNGIMLETDFPENDLEIEVDSEAITKLMCNLMNNEMKFTKDHIKVIYKRADNPDFVEIIIKDNGVGISKEKRVIFLKMFP